MQYFRIRQDNRTENAILPQLNVTKELWTSEQPLFIPVKARNNSGQLHFLPFIEKPVAMVSDAAKKIFEVYQSKTLYRPCAVGHLEQGRTEVYWLIQPRILPCLHEAATYFPDGSLKEIVIDRQKAGFNKWFMLDQVREACWIVDTEVLERLCRAGITEIQILPVRAL
ncbi:hypothetical protein [Paenibacillus sp. Leaf72]|uniref:hypothetical protein n=1 Tax=Paenibacillus sp. Leaf72 TaxID=1736234 RepID=UPI0006F2C6E4|nr:hypothetical protein [Paenibacillus sp. Leaf72]KQO06235.1 hypothetical protein ASF12_32575 [Paenibacillus sp. Leaf72]